MKIQVRLATLVCCAWSAIAFAQIPAQVGQTPVPSLAPMLKRVTPAIVNIATKGTVQQENPLLNDPFLTVNQFTVTGATTSNDSFCGFVGGYGQVFGVEPSDRVRLEGSTFGAVRISGETLPAPVGSCSEHGA